MIDQKRITLPFLALFIVALLFIYISFRVSAKTQPLATFDLSVDGRANIFGAGKSFPPSPGGGGGGILPPYIPLNSPTPQLITFSEIQGTVSGWRSGCPYADADGSSGCGGATNVSSYEGISGIRHDNKTMFLVGVFVDASEPTNPAPPRLDVTDANEVLQFSPMLNQVFFIGDGHTSSGEVQEFNVPAGATRLFLGFAETFGFDGDVPGLPGYYIDNGGSLAVTNRSFIYLPVIR